MNCEAKRSAQPIQKMSYFAWDRSVPPGKVAAKCEVQTRLVSLGKLDYFIDLQNRLVPQGKVHRSVNFKIE